MNRLDNTVEDTLVETLRRFGPCCPEDLIVRFPNHDWNEIFATVGRMSQDGRLVLSRVPGLWYQLSLPMHSSGKKERYK